MLSRAIYLLTCLMQHHMTKVILGSQENICAKQQNDVTAAWLRARSIYCLPCLCRCSKSMHGQSLANSEPFQLRLGYRAIIKWCFRHSCNIWFRSTLLFYELLFSFSYSFNNKYCRLLSNWVANQQWVTDRQTDRTQHHIIICISDVGFLSVSIYDFLFISVKASSHEDSSRVKKIRVAQQPILIGLSGSEANWAWIDWLHLGYVTVNESFLPVGL